MPCEEQTEIWLTEIWQESSIIFLDWFMILSEITSLCIHVHP